MAALTDNKRQSAAFIFGVEGRKISKIIKTVKMKHLKLQWMQFFFNEKKDEGKTDTSE